MAKFNYLKKMPRKYYKISDSGYARNIGSKQSSTLWEKKAKMIPSTNFSYSNSFSRKKKDTSVPCTYGKNCGLTSATRTPSSKK
jgi:hypothetical protein